MYTIRWSMNLPRTVLRSSAVPRSRPVRCCGSGSLKDVRRWPAARKAMYHLSTMVLAEHSRWCTWGARFVRWAAPSRGSGSLEAGTQELFAESLAKGRLNMPLANAVRVMLLEPEQSAQAPYPFRCTALSPVFTLEAHSACLLYEIPEKDFRSESRPTALLLGSPRAP